VTFDVKSLHTSIPHSYDLEAIDYWLTKHPESLHPRFTKEFILECVAFILANNNCKFNNEYFTQIGGMAMGTIFAPTYATLTMGFFEIKLYDLCELNWGPITKQYVIKNWSRFLDDCEIPIDRNILEPDQLLAILNSIIPEIQFTMECSELAIPFLDILIEQKNNTISMDLYRKPTDTQRCLHFKSNHPKHCLKNIPFAMARRICTIVENTKHLNQLRQKPSKIYVSS